MCRISVCFSEIKYISNKLDASCTQMLGTMVLVSGSDYMYIITLETTEILSFKYIITLETTEILSFKCLHNTVSAGNLSLNV